MKRTDNTNIKISALIELLINSPAEYITSLKLSSLLGISTRMVFRYMKEAQEQGEEHGYEILSFKGKGYQIKVTDKEAFHHFTQLYARPDRFRQEGPAIREVLKKILLTDTCKMDDLAEIFSYSRSSMSRITAAANSYLEQFGLSLESKAYTGLYVKGDEISIRECMFHLYADIGEGQALWTQLELQETSYEKIDSWLNEWQEKEGILANHKEHFQFLCYLAITMKRIALKKEIDFGYFADLEGLELLQNNMKAISQMLAGWFPDSSLNGESMYLALIRMQTFRNGKERYPLKNQNMIFIHNLVIEALEKIQQNYGVDLSADEFLVNGLTFHVASHYGKYLLHMETENPFYEELQKSYPTAYYYAIELAECIAKYTNAGMPGSELGFLIMHFASCLERNLGVRKWKTAILGDNAFGTSLLLKSRIEKQFETIEVIGIYPYSDVKLLPRNVDFYVSPVTMINQQQYEHEVLSLSPLLNKEDQELVTGLLTRLQNRAGSISITEVCSRERFFIWDKPGKKKTLLASLCQQLRQQGIMKPEDEVALFNREALVSTEITADIAMPHCLIEGTSFISFVLLETPLVWGRTVVRLVILVCMQKGDTRFKEVLERLFQMIKDEEIVQKLLACSGYDEFIGHIEEFEGGKRC